MRAVAYLRVSTDRQAERGLGLDVQSAAITAWAKQGRHRVVAVTADEGVSGSNGLDSRVGLLDALTAVRERRADGIVVYRLDRLARDLVLQEQLLREVWSVSGRVWSTSASEDAYLDPDGADSDPSRQLIRQVLGAVASYERQMIRLRMQAGRRRKAEAGGYAYGAPAFGQRAEGGVLVVDDDEQATVRRAVALRAEGLSLREIGAVLTAEGHRTKRGGQWHPYTVRQVLLRAAS